MKQLALIATLLAAATAASAAGPEARRVAAGKAIVKQNCGRCHAIGTDDASTHAKAPPFRDVVKRYPPAALAEALAEGILSGHPDMPEFTFEPTAIDAIIAYLDTLSAP